MGAGSFIEPRLRELTGGEIPIRYLGRPDRASPAEGSLYIHNDEQARIVEAAFTDVPAISRRRTNGAVGNGKNGATRETAIAGSRRKK